jgi:oligoendopeptidase F
MKLDDLAYHDLYAPLVDRVDTAYSWDRSKDLVLAAFAPMGRHYVEKLGSVLEKRWVDVLPRPGKRAGAYVSGDVYDVHPYMLLNHQDNHESLTTLAHEIGHLMHSLYSNEAQPYPTAGYSTFVAEVASTTAEWLLFRHLADNSVSGNGRLSILGSFLESIRTTVFRQTLFAGFERFIHNQVEKGEPLTADGLDEAYLLLLRRYYGHLEGVCRVDDIYAAEWAYVPHFHYNYYVFTYATSFVAASAFAEQILTRGPDRYLERLLRAGSSRPPVEILRDAGVDVTRAEPIRTTMNIMAQIMDQMEAILDGAE